MRRAVFRWVWALSAGLVALPSLAAGAPIGMLTIIDGETLVMRDALKFAGAEGLPLHADDIVHTGSKARLVRIEFTDGGALDLGPATRVLLRLKQLYVLQGWVKLTASPGLKLALSSPALDLSGVTGAAVACVRKDASFVFIEAGQAKLVEHLHGQPLRALALKDGHAYERHAGDAAAVISRPSTEMVESMPRAFADSLPLRAARYKEAQVAPALSMDVTYQDVAPWINAERALRPAFVPRLTAKSLVKKKAQAAAKPAPVTTRNVDGPVATVAATQLSASADTTRSLRPWEERAR